MPDLGPGLPPPQRHIQGDHPQPAHQVRGLSQGELAHKWFGPLGSYFLLLFPLPKNSIFYL